MFPAEIIEKITKYCDLTTSVRVRRTCKSLARGLPKPMITTWKYLNVYSFPEFTLVVDDHGRKLITNGSTKLAKDLYLVTAFDESDHELSFEIKYQGEGSFKCMFWEGGDLKPRCIITIPVEFTPTGVSIVAMYVRKYLGDGIPGKKVEKFLRESLFFPGL